MKFLVLCTLIASINVIDASNTKLISHADSLEGGLCSFALATLYYYTGDCVETDDLTQPAGPGIGFGYPAAGNKIDPRCCSSGYENGFVFYESSPAFIAANGLTAGTGFRYLDGTIYSDPNYVKHKTITPSGAVTAECHGHLPSFCPAPKKTTSFTVVSPLVVDLKSKMETLCSVIRDNNNTGLAPVNGTARALTFNPDGSMFLRCQYKPTRMLREE